MTNEQTEKKRKYEDLTFTSTSYGPPVDVPPPKYAFDMEPMSGAGTVPGS